MSDCLAAAATLLVVLYVAFVRDFSDLGSSPSFTRYGLMCLLVIAPLCFLGVLGTVATRGEVRGAVLLAIGCLVAAGIPAVDGTVRLCTPVVEPIGRLLGLEPATWACHGFATTLTVLVAVALMTRIIRARGLSAAVGPWDVFLAFALGALVQGALAYRGVSAIYILAAAGLVASLGGWRARVTRADGEFVLKVTRSLAPARAETARPAPEYVA